MSLIWPNHVLHRTSRRSGKDTKIRCAGSKNSLLNEKDWSSTKQDVMQSSFTIHSQLVVSRKLLWWNMEKSNTRKLCVTSTTTDDFLQRYLGERIGFRSRWKQQRHPTNPTNTKNPIIKNGETRRCTRIHLGDRKRYLVWSRGHQALNKNGETRRWINIHTELRVEAYKNWRRRSNKNGETRWWTRVHQRGRAQHWLQNTRIVTCSCERSRTFPSSRACQKIESHPHREALQVHLQQNNVYNTLSNNSKAMIHKLGNVELFELCETIPKVQCSHCLPYWNQGIVYCTCGQCLIDSESRRKFDKLRLDALSIPNNVIKKGPNHGARHDKTNEQTEYHIAWNAWKGCCEKDDS